jgi:transposase
MDQYELIRTAARVYKKSIRQIARETGHTRKTIRKVLAGWEPKYRRRQEPPCRVMDSAAAIIDGWLRADQEAPKKQRHTAHRIWTRLVDEYAFPGAESTVRRWVREHKAHMGWPAMTAVLPLDPEIAQEAEVDWGAAWVRMAGQDRQVRLFCMRSRYSGLPFVRAYPYERQEMFLDGHLRAFAFYGGVFPVLVYDNLTTAVRQILRGKARVEQERFTAFRSYYTFQARFCTPAQGREKGGVEGLVGLARRNFLVPIPEVQDFEALNDLLLRRCSEQGSRRISGRDDSRTIEQRHQDEQTRLLPLPDRPFENTRICAVRISPYQTAQVDRNRYSVPTAYVGRWLWAHVGCDRVALYADHRQVAKHARVFGVGQWQLDPLHYLDLLEQRVGAFESARAIRHWRSAWPAQYERMLEGLRRRHGESRGTREFVRILKLHHDAPAARVQEAVAEALRLQTYSLEAVRHLLRRQEPVLNPAPLGAELLPGITDLLIAQTDVGRYDRLLAGVAP